MQHNTPGNSSDLSFTEFSGQKTYFFITFFRQKNKRTYSALSFCSFDKKTCHVARLNKP